MKYKLSTSVHAIITSQCILRSITGHGSTIPDHHISFSLTGKDKICYFASMLPLGLNEKTPSYQSPCTAKVRATTWYLCRPHKSKKWFKPSSTRRPPSQHSPPAEIQVPYIVYYAFCVMCLDILVLLFCVILAWLWDSAVWHTPTTTEPWNKKCCA